MRVLIAVLLLLGLLALSLLSTLAPTVRVSAEEKAPVAKPSGAMPGGARLDTGKSGSPEVKSAADALPASSDGKVWSMFRGNPYLTGLAPAEALPEKLELLWKRETGLHIASSAAVVDGRVYIGGDALGTPLGGKSGDGILLALDLATGEVQWSVKLADPITASPAVAAGRVFIGDEGGTLHVLDLAGKPLWKAKTEDKISGSAVVVGGQVFFGSFDGHLYCHDAATGKQTWKFKTEDQPVNCTPAVASGSAFISGCDQYLHVIDTVTGKERVQINMDGQAGASPALVGDRAYVGTFANEFLCMDWKTGQVIWRYSPEREQPFYSSAAVTADRVIVGGRDKNVHCLNRATGKPIWIFPTRARVDSSPVVVGDRVFIGSNDGRIYALKLSSDKPTGESLWSYELGSAVAAAPAVAEGRLVIASSKGVVYCFGARAR